MDGLDFLSKSRTSSLKEIDLIQNELSFGVLENITFIFLMK